MNGMIERFQGRTASGSRTTSRTARTRRALRKPRRSTAPGSATAPAPVPSGRPPAGAKGEEATESYEDGVLTSTVPAPEGKTGTGTIPVRHG